MTFKVIYGEAYKITICTMSSFHTLGLYTLNP